jgi:cytosine/adenosine deaminase-related metal-dependent hydrolase
MSDLVIHGALGMLTGLTGAAERATGDIRIRDGRIAMIGDVGRMPGDRMVDATGCVITPGLISTHHHLFQSVLKGVPAGIDCELEAWLRLVPYSHWNRLDEDALRVAAEIGMVELLLSGCTTLADHHYLFDSSYDFDIAEILFETAARLGIRLTLARGAARRAAISTRPRSCPCPMNSSTR